MAVGIFGCSSLWWRRRAWLDLSRSQDSTRIDQKCAAAVRKEASAKRKTAPGEPPGAESTRAETCGARAGRRVRARAAVGGWRPEASILEDNVPLAMVCEPSAAVHGGRARSYMGKLAALEPELAPDVGHAGRPEYGQTGARLGRGDRGAGRGAGAAAVRRGEAGAG
jgi:hypothetical protein